MKKRTATFFILTASMLLMLGGCGDSGQSNETLDANNAVSDSGDTDGTDDLDADTTDESDAALNDSTSDAENFDSEDLNSEDFDSDAEPMYVGASSSGGFAFCANGGEMTFSSADANEFTSPVYTYWLEDDQALNDIMGTDAGDALISIEKEGAAFDGWTLYEAESLFSSEEPITDEAEEIQWFTYNENAEYGTYVLLRNPIVYGENLPTEQLCGITCEGKNYYAIANWK